MAILTRENVIESFDGAVKGKAPDFDTMITLSFYMDYAISTKDLEIIDAIHNRITSYFLEAYSRSYKTLEKKETAKALQKAAATQNYPVPDVPKDFEELEAAATAAYAAWRRECPEYPFPPITTLCDLEYLLYVMCETVMAYRKGKNTLTMDELCDYVMALYGYAMTERG